MINKYEKQDKSKDKDKSKSKRTNNYTNIIYLILSRIGIK